MLSSSRNWLNRGVLQNTSSSKADWRTMDWFGTSGKMLVFAVGDEPEPDIDGVVQNGFFAGVSEVGSGEEVL